MTSQHLMGRVAVVTGGAQGLGRAFAHRLAEGGAVVVVADRNVDSARCVAEELATSTEDQSRGVAMKVDVADEGSVQAMCESVDATFGRLDILVNDAAIFSALRMKPFEEIPVSEWDEVMSVNVRGPFLCARGASPIMRRHGYGKIINVSSSTIWFGRTHYLHYVTSKAALIGMTRSLATELGPHGIRVNAVTPGSTETEVQRATVTAEQSEAIVATQSIKRRERPDDLVGAVAFLAGPESDFITGQTLNVDGGASYH